MIFVLLAFVSDNGDNNLPQLQIVVTGARPFVRNVQLNSQLSPGSQPPPLPSNICDRKCHNYLPIPAPVRAERGWKLISNFTDRGDNLLKNLIQTNKNILSRENIQRPQPHNDNYILDHLAIKSL